MTDVLFGNIAIESQWKMGEGEAEEKGIRVRLYS